MSSHPEISRGALPRSLRRVPTLDTEAVHLEAQTNAKRELHPQCFKDGTILEQLAFEHCESFRALFNGKRNFVPSCEITMGSACTGSACEVSAAYYFEKAAQPWSLHSKISPGAQPRSLQSFRIRNVFSCESSEQKRKWIHGMHQAFVPSSGSAQGDPGRAQGVSDSSSAQGTSESPCVFCDILELGKSTARCVTHSSMCTVPHCCIFVCCTSCKDISRLSAGTAGQQILQQTSSSGGSAQTFQGMLGYIEWARPAIILFENVEAIADGGGGGEDTNLDIVLSEFASRGYECQQMIGDCSRYGVPQRRKRFYIVALLVVASSHINFLERSVQETFQTLRSLIKVGQREPPCLSQLLYSGTDARVVRYLEERRASQTKVTSQCYSVHTAITASIAQGVSWSTIQPPAWTKSSQWFQTLTPQQKHVIAYSSHTDDSKVLLRDINASHTRVRLSVIDDGGKHLSFTVLPKQLCVVFKGLGEAPRLLLGEEAMMIQGFPVAKVSDLVAKTPNKLLQDIAGNMTANPVLLLLLMSAVACVHWSDGRGPGELKELGESLQQAHEASASEEIDGAMHALRLLVGAGRDADDSEDDAPSPCEKKRRCV